MPASDAIARRARSATVIDAASGSYDANGDFIADAPAGRTIKAFITALIYGRGISGIEMKDMPEGIRDEAAAIMWTRDTIATDEKVAQGGTTYRVLHVWNRAGDGGFYRAALGAVA